MLSPFSAHRPFMPLASFHFFRELEFIEPDVAFNWARRFGTGRTLNADCHRFGLSVGCERKLVIGPSAVAVGQRLCSDSKTLSPDEAIGRIEDLDQRRAQALQFVTPDRKSQQVTC